MILITGGAGYIGSHTNKALNNAGYETVVLDNLCKGYENFVKWGNFENYDFGTGIDKKLDVNLMFLDDLNVYLFAKDSSLFKSRIEAAKKLTAQDYWEQDLRINGLEHKSIKETFFTDRNKY